MNHLITVSELHSFVYCLCCLCLLLAQLSPRLEICKRQLGLGNGHPKRYVWDKLKYRNPRLIVIAGIVELWRVVCRCRTFGNRGIPFHFVCFRHASTDSEGAFIIHDNPLASLDHLYPCPSPGCCKGRGFHAATWKETRSKNNKSKL